MIIPGAEKKSEEGEANGKLTASYKEVGLEKNSKYNSADSFFFSVCVAYQVYVKKEEKEDGKVYCT